MKVVYAPEHARHDGGRELHRGELVPCFEAPARARLVLDSVTRAGLEVLPPEPFAEDALLAVHDPAFVRFLRTAHAEWRAAGKGGSMLPSAFPARTLRRDRIPAGLNGRMGHYAFDPSTPIVEGTFEAALASARCALTAASFVAAGARSAYALCRPPGHHAGRALYGGYCYLNNAALAAEHLRARGARRVAIVDVDAHHGNGTQEIFWERGDVLFASIHGTPDSDYPYFLGFEDERGEGEGEGRNRNFPLPRDAGWREYEPALGAALDLVAGFAPDALVVSLGVDAFEGDPVGPLRLTRADLAAVGAALGGLRLPTVLVQEGGYAVDALGENVVAVLEAFERA